MTAAGLEGGETSETGLETARSETARPETARPEADLTVVIPAFNEAAAVGQVVASVFENCGDIVSQVIVVDDGSADETARAAEQAGARVLRHPVNRGYGAALKTGILAAGSGWIATLDADGQHDTSDLRGLCQRRGGYDMVIGSRRGLLHSQLWRMPGKWLLWAMASYLVGQRIPDLNSGLRLMRSDAARRFLHLCPQGFSFSTTITMAMLTRGHAVGWHAIDVQPRVGTSTVNLWVGLSTIVLILRISTLFNPLRVFLPASFFCVFAGCAWGLPYLLMGQGLSVGAMLAIVAGFLLFFLGLISDQISQLRLERFDFEPYDGSGRGGQA